MILIQRSNGIFFFLDGLRQEFEAVKGDFCSFLDIFHENLLDGEMGFEELFLGVVEVEDHLECFEDLFFLDSLERIVFFLHAQILMV